MLLLSNYQECRQNSSVLPSPLALQHPISEFLRNANDAIKEDIRKEKADSVSSLKKGNVFKAFYEANMADFEAFGYFIFDHQGTYDGKRMLYNWKHLYPVVTAIFMFNVKMPYRSRLIGLTRQYDLAAYAMDDPEICLFVVHNFKIYADLEDTFPDEHGRHQVILERLYARLHRLNRQKPFEKTTSQWCLKTLIYQYLYAEGLV